MTKNSTSGFWPAGNRCTAFVILGVAAYIGAGSVANAALSHYFNKPGDILISDQFNNRVIEIDPRGNIVWQFGRGPNDLTAKSPIGVNDAQRVGTSTLVSGTGTPSGVIPQAPDGAVDNRVMLVDPNGRIIWQYGQFGQTGDGFNLLSTPVQSTWLPNG